MHLRDVVLEGARPGEVEVLNRLSRDPDFRPPAEVTHRLRAKGWLETYGGAHLITVAGRTLLDKR